MSLSITDCNAWASEGSIALRTLTRPMLAPVWAPPLALLLLLLLSLLRHAAATRTSTAATTTHLAAFIRPPLPSRSRPGIRVLASGIDPAFLRHPATRWIPDVRPPAPLACGTPLTYPARLSHRATRRSKHTETVGHPIMPPGSAFAITPSRWCPNSRVIGIPVPRASPLPSIGGSPTRWGAAPAAGPLADRAAAGAARATPPSPARGRPAAW